MKRILWIMMAAVLGIASAFAAAPTGKALTFQGQVKAYLQSEGYVPEIDGDGDIKFKAEGHTLYISLSNWNSGVYMDMYTILGISDSNLAKVRRAADDAQKSLKFCRVDIMSEETMTVDVTEYFTSITEFKEVFSDFLDIIMKGRKRFLENYND